MMKYLEHTKLKELKDESKNWEKWCDCKILNRHVCQDEQNRDELSIHDAAIFYASSGNMPSSWFLGRVWLADQKEVSDGEADEIGEVISFSSFHINFCPFCGVNLLKLKNMHNQPGGGDGEKLAGFS